MQIQCCSHSSPTRIRAGEPVALSAAQVSTSGAADSVALGVVDMRSHQKVAFDTAQAALWAVDAAVQAATRGTFGVGGALLGPHKELLAISCNRVISGGKVADPTAHGERQLVDWYYEQRDLPAPQDCTIVSSLDPCMMCAGSILTSGMKVVSTTLDTRAGVNCHQDQQYSTVPPSLREQARQSFAYFGVAGERPYLGPSIFGERASISGELEKRSLDTFLGSLGQVQSAIHGSHQGPLQNLSECRDPQVLGALRKGYGKALEMRFEPGRPGPELAQELLRAGDNAAALLDPHGNLVMVTGGESRSPIRTPLMELTRKWARVRAEAGPEGEKYLAHIKDCTVVTLYGPGPDAAGTMELGAYGSSVEGPVPQQGAAGWQYVLPRQSPAQLSDHIASLPPLYSEVIRPRVEQVLDRELIARVQAGR